MTTLYAVEGTGVLCGYDGPEIYLNVKIGGDLHLSDAEETPEGKNYPIVSFRLQINRQQGENICKFSGGDKNIYMTNHDNILTLHGEGFWNQWQFIKEEDCSTFGYELPKKNEISCQSNISECP